MNQRSLCSRSTPVTDRAQFESNQLCSHLENLICTPFSRVFAFHSLYFDQRLFLFLRRDRARERSSEPNCNFMIRMFGLN
jgi:hypothetical protein